MASYLANHAYLQRPVSSNLMADLVNGVVHGCVSYIKVGKNFPRVHWLSGPYSVPNSQVSPRVRGNLARNSADECLLCACKLENQHQKMSSYPKLVKDRWILICAFDSCQGVTKCLNWNLYSCGYTLISFVLLGLP